MPRKYVRKTNRQNWNPESMRGALEEVKNGLPYKTASKMFNVPLMSLKRRAKGTNVIAKNESKILGSKVGVFSPEQENELVTHILDFETRMYGFTTRDLRRLAYQLAEKNNIPHKFSHEHQAAGKEWLYGFQKRHPEISLRCPEATSAARARAFNKPAVTKFFQLLKEVLNRHTFPPHRIYNVDETSISTVPGRNSRIFAKKGRKQVARVTSAERGESTTAVICMSAGGAFIPPMMIFNRKRMKAELTDGAPPGTIFACNDTGWMRLEVFSAWFDHFLSFVKPSKDDPALLILDGHLSHTKNLDVIEKARANYVTILCLPPHCSHKLQPLDVGVMFPLSIYTDQALEKWLNNHPGRTVTSFQISRIFCEAYLRAATQQNCVKAFRKTGICPYNPEVFSDVDFIAASVTEQLLDQVTQQHQEIEPLNPEIQQQTSLSDLTSTERSLDNPQPGPSWLPDEWGSTNSSKSILERDMATTTPEKTHSSFAAHGPADCHPLPRIQGKRCSGKRKSVGSVVLTSTPYKAALEEDKKRKAEEKEKKNMKATATKGRSLKGKSIMKKKITVKKASSSSSSGEADDTECVYCLEKYSDSLGGESWIRCTRCLKWAHEQCTSCEDGFFICDFCRDIPVNKVRKVLKID